MTDEVSPDRSGEALGDALGTGAPEITALLDVATAEEEMDEAGDVELGGGGVCVQIDASQSVPHAVGRPL